MTRTFASIDHDMTTSPILFVDHAPALGGAELSLLMILAHLDRSKWTPHLICAGGPLAERAAALRVPTHVVPLPRLRRSSRAPLDLWGGVHALISAARDTQAALIVANTVRAALYAAPAARLGGIPFIWYRRDFWLGESQPRYLWVDAALKRLLCAAATRVICNSEATARRHPCGQRITVVHNGIDLQRFVPAVEGVHFRQAYDIPDDALVVGTVGRLCAVKGQDRFLRVFARTLETLPGVWGVVVGGAIFGENDYVTRLHHLTQDLGIAHRVIFTGQLDDPAPALAAMDIFVQTGDPEAFGLVNVEAMATGKPVVAYRHGALPEIVTDGQTGILVAPRDEAGMAAAIVQLLRDPVLRAEMGQAGRTQVAERFTIERVVAEVSAVFREVARG